MEYRLVGSFGTEYDVPNGNSDLLSEKLDLFLLNLGSRTDRLLSLPEIKSFPVEIQTAIGHSI
ncbi:hypothetical protein [Bacillus sp. UMB0893]|uniref:hypothetical protein n=1 Tax=Bacillus sp. UMB0893 TaxID=2066053 RepID=UPI000C76B9AB|nr:hypothetical protein [Bacillus sp. UMB0893]PLR67239.1 hypothetical protein CYJ36_14825 [Bacillus sp. UMB0893]